MLPRARPSVSSMFLLLAVLLLCLSSCERPKETFWVPGAKPTAFSASSRVVSRDAPRAEDDRGEPKEAREADPGEAAVQDRPKGALPMPELMSQLRAFGDAERSGDRKALARCMRRIEAMERAPLEVGLVRVLRRNEEGLGPSAARIAGRLKVHSALRSLYERLSMQDVFMARAAAEALGDMNDPAAVPWLVAALARQPSASVRGAVLEALGKLKDRSALTGIMEAVHDPDATVRQAAARVLGKLGTAEEHHARLHALIKDPSHLVRVSAALSLAELRAPEAVDSLVGLLSDPSEEARKSALKALIAFPDRLNVRTKLMYALEHGEGEDRLSYSQALKAVCDCSCLPDLNHMAEHNRNVFVRNASKALAQEIGSSCR